MSITSIVNDTIGRESFVSAQKPVPPTITGYTISGSDDTALDPAGGQTILLNGTGFQRGATISINGNAVAVVSFVSSNQLSFTSPALSAGTYTIYVVNADLGTAIYIPGLVYSNLPAWTTGAGSLGSYYETKSISNTVVASGDAPITYSLVSGSLPSGATLYANGTISGTAPVDSGSTTYSFTIEATDAQLQSSTRSFSLTINTDVVTWTNPTNGATINLDGAAYSNILTATSAAGYSIDSFTANTLPTGLSLSGNTISGTPTVQGNVTTLLTATAATTGRSATNTITWVVTLGDTYWNNVITLLSPTLSITPFNDDASTNNFALTINGDTRPNNFNPYTPGYYSNYFDGTGDFLSSPTSTATAFGTGDYTIEGWIYRTDSNVQRAIVDTRGADATGVLFYITSEKLNLFDSSTVYLTSTNTIPIFQWVHVAVTRSSSTTRLFINGVVDATLANDTRNNATGAAGCYIGRQFGSTVNDFLGYMSNVRILKGTALYTANFTPPTDPLTAIANTSLLTCQSNRFIDNSTNNFAITRNGDTRISSFDPYLPNSSYSTYGSTYFDGTGDYLTPPASQSSLQPGSGDFTIEFWFYPTLTITGYINVFSYGAAGNTLRLFEYTNNTLMLWTGATPIITSTANAVVLNVWSHVAIVRSGTTITLYVNGVSVGTATSSTNYVGDLSIGYEAGQTLYVGYLSNFRLVKGTAVYTATFTPPTSPLTAITNTQLLTCQSNQPANNNAFLDSSTNNFLVTRAGNTTQGTFSPYGENWSNYFDGSGDYLTTPSNSWTSLAGQFTLEFWVNFTTIPTANPFIGVNSAGGFNIYNDGTRLTPNIFGTGNIFNSTLLLSSLTAGTWYHIAVTRNSSNLMTIWLNGESKGSTTTSSSYTAGAWQIGNSNFNCYISNFRATSTCLYTTSFTPSTTPLQPIANTVLLTCKDPNLIDDSANNFTITRNGDVSVQKFGPFAGTTLPTPYYSAYFGGGGLTATYDTAFSLGTDDFTVEFFVYPTAYMDAVYTSWVNSPSPRFIGINTSGYPYLFDGSSIVATSSTVVNLNTWTHVAFSRTSGTLRIFVNGVQTYSGANSTNLSGSALALFFLNPSTGSSLLNNAYVSNYRMVKGTGVYTSAFTPSTVPLTAISGTSLLICQSNRLLVDNSPNNFTISSSYLTAIRVSSFSPFTLSYSTKQSYTPAVFGGSMYFDGTGDYLDIPNNVLNQLSGAQYTIEMWLYPTTTGTERRIFNKNDASTFGYLVYLSASNVVSYRTDSTNMSTGTLTAPINQWTHIAITNDGTTTRIFVNGILSVSSTGVTITSANEQVALRIGARVYLADLPYTGYISDARLVKGQALYTSNFVPENKPLVAVRNSVLLLNGTSAGIYDSSEMANFETVGDSKLSTTTVKFSGTTSMYFDGGGDYLVAPNNVAFDFSSSNFTIECWVYPTTVPAEQAVFSKRATTGAYTPILFGLKSSGGVNKIYIVGSTSGSSWGINGGFTAGSITIPINTWTHIACVRNGTTITGYVNGVADLTFTGISAALMTNATSIAVGASTTAGDAAFNGYISDFRITKGIARYTANFTVPSTPFNTK